MLVRASGNYAKKQVEFGRLPSAALREFDKTTESDWEDGIRIHIEERLSLSPDVQTGMEASLRFAGPRESGPTFRRPPMHNLQPP